LRPISTPEA